MAAFDTRDALRKLSSKIRAAGTDLQRQGEALQVAERVSRTYGDLLRMTLEDFTEPQHQPGSFMFPLEWGGAMAGPLGMSPRGRIYNLTITDAVDCEIIECEPGA